MPADRDLSASASVRSRAFGRGSALREFFRWWADELAGLVPQRTRAAMQRRRMRPVLAFDGDAATLWLPAMQDGQPSMQPGPRIVLGGDAAATAASARAVLDAARGAASGDGAKLVVALPARQTLRRVLRLPAAVEENLKQALAYDLDRHTPFKSEDVYFDAAVVERDAARGEIKVELAAARRPVVDQVLAQAESFGVDVAAIAPGAPVEAALSRLSLLPDERQPRGGYGFAWRIGVPALLLVLLVGVAIAVPIWQKREYAIALGRSVDEARAQAAVSERVKAELDRLTGDYNFALERKFAFPSSVQALEEITKLLPDDTWLTQMEMKSVSRGKDAQRELLLRGESVNAGRLITAFEESRVFTQAAPRSPTTKIQPGPGEIFDLAAQLRPLPAPAPVALAELAAASAAGSPPAPGAVAPSGATSAAPPAGAVPGRTASGAPAFDTPRAPAAAGASPAAVGAPPAVGTPPLPAPSAAAVPSASTSQPPPAAPSGASADARKAGKP